MRLALTFGYLLWLALVPASAANATILDPVDVAQLVDEAELIFIGRAVHREVATTGDGRYPYTFVTFEVEDTLKGAVAESSLTLRFEGGELGEEYVLVHGMPTFERSVRYLLFVHRNGQAICPLVGWGQGQFELVPHPSRAGEEILLDAFGAAIEGVAHGRFQRTDIERLDDGDIRPVSPSGVTVLEEVGVTISGAEPRGDHELMPARMTLQQLQALANADTTVMSPVRSSHPWDVPATYRNAQADSSDRNATPNR